MFVPSSRSRAAIRFAVRITLLLVAATAFPVGAATPTELHPPRLAPTTVMEKEMEALRGELNRLARETQRIVATRDPAARQALLQAQLVRLRDAASSMRAMDTRMHEAFVTGQVTTDTGARERHALFLEQVVLNTDLLVRALAPTGDSPCKPS